MASRKLKTDLESGEKLKKDSTKSVTFDKSKLSVSERCRITMMGIVDAMSQRPPRNFEPGLEQFPYQDDYNQGYLDGKDLFVNLNKDIKKCFEPDE